MPISDADVLLATQNFAAASLVVNGDETQDAIPLPLGGTARSLRNAAATIAKGDKGDTGPAGTLTLSKLVSVLTGQPEIPTGNPGSTIFGAIYTDAQVPATGNGIDTWFLNVPITVAEPITDIQVGMRSLTAGAKLKFVLATPGVDGGGQPTVHITNEWEYTISNAASGFTVVHLTEANGDFVSVTPQAGQIFGVYSTVGQMAFGNLLNNADGTLQFAGGDQTAVNSGYGVNNNGQHPCFAITVSAGTPVITTLDPEGYRGLSNLSGLPNGGSVGAEISDAIMPDQPVALIELESYCAARSWVPSVFQMPATNKTVYAFGDSLTQGLGANGVDANAAFPHVMSVALGCALYNQGQSTDEAPDTCQRLWNTQVASAASAIYTLMIGSTEALHQAAPVLPVHKAAHLALIAWMASGPSACVDLSQNIPANWTAYSNYAAATGRTSTTNGAAFTSAVVARNNVIYVFSICADNNAGSFSISIDGGAATNVTCSSAIPIVTPNGASSYIQLTRIPTTNGAHNVTITVTSASGNGNVVTIMAVGTPLAHAYYGAVVICGGVIPVEGDPLRLLDAQYTQNVIDNVLTIQGDGGDVRFADTRAYIKAGNSAIYIAQGNPHLTPAGYTLLAQPFIKAALMPPASSVNRATPPAGSKGTPGDTWCANGTIYGVNADQSIHFVATTGTV